MFTWHRFADKIIWIAPSSQLYTISLLLDLTSNYKTETKNNYKSQKQFVVQLIFIPFTNKKLNESVSQRRYVKWTLSKQRSTQRKKKIFPDEWKSARAQEPNEIIVTSW